MAGVRWLAERRVLRRTSHQSLKVPVFRDQSFDELSRYTPADPYVRGDWDVGYRRDDGQDGQRGEDTADAEQTAPLPVIRELPPQEAAERARMEDVSWDEASRREQSTLPANPSNGLTFKPVNRPWYWSQRVLMSVVGAAVVAMIVAGVLLVLRDSNDGTEDTTAVTQTATTSASPQPSPSATAGDVPPPAIAPPPPPPPEETPTAPGGSGGYYRWTPRSQSETPTDRPRVPAPSSFAPLPRPAPTPGHAAPGDGPVHHRGFFG